MHPKSMSSGRQEADLAHVGNLDSEVTRTSDKDLIRIRMLFTGESYSTAKNAIMSCGGFGNPLPDAQDPQQAQLEHDLLTAIVGFPGQTQWWPQDCPLTIESVSPYPDRLDIVVPSEHLAVFCERILPASECAHDRLPVEGIGVVHHGRYPILARRDTPARIQL